MAATPIGMLTKKIQRQQAHSVRDAADEGADRHGCAGRRNPDPECGAAFPAVECLGQKGERNREHDAAADPLHGASSDEQLCVGRDPAAERCNGEQYETDE